MNKDLEKILREIEETNRLLTALLQHKVPVHPDVDDMLWWDPENDLGD